MVVRTGALSRAVNAALMGAAITSTTFALAGDPRITIEQGANRPSLTIRYKNAVVSTIELQIDGVTHQARSLVGSGNEGEALFVLDGIDLAAGEHTVVARLLDSRGKLLGAGKGTISVRVNPDSPLMLLAPRFGAEVSGVQEIDVQVAEGSKRPYISFFVDSKFKTLRNFPPYTYSWDTTQETNGWHELLAMSFDEDQNSLKSAPVRVFVNNPTGRTARQIPNPTADNTAPPPVVVQNPKPITIAKAMSPPISARPVTPAAARWSRVEARATSPIAHTSPSTLVVKAPLAALSASPMGQALSLPSAVLEPATLTPPTVGSVPVPASVRMRASGFAPEHTQGTVALQPPALAAPAVRLAPAIRISVRPGTKPRVAVKAIAPRVRPSVAMKSPVSFNLISLNWGTRLKTDHISVWVGGKPIRFDVMPIVENGIPLAPFRQIFEQSGGSVVWNSGNKTVSAHSGDREIRLRVGSKTAEIDASEVALERAPFLSEGRTIVPLTFMGAALDATVEYDARTGRILITAK